MKRIPAFIIAASIISLTSCYKNYDNKEAPNAAIKGTVKDANSNQPLQTEQPNGIRIRLLQQGYDNVTPIDVWAKQDGTFENAALFAGQYKVVTIEGPFFPADTQLVTINGTTDVTFNVVPFLTVSATITPGIGKVSVDYNIGRTQAAQKIQEAKVFASRVPTVSNAVNDKSVTRNLSGIADDTILMTTYTNELTGLTSGNTYYIRVGVRINASPTRYNYTEPVAVTIP